MAPESTRARVDFLEPLAPTTTSRKRPITYDVVAYRQRNTVERLWIRLKDYRRVTTR